jgi:exosortase
VPYGDEAPPSLPAIVGRNGLLQFVVLGALVLIVFWNPLRWSVVYRWQNDADWSHGWLVPLFSLYFLNVHRDRLALAVRKTSYVGLAIVVLSLTAYFWTLAIRPVTYARPLCFVSTVFGLTLFLGGWQVIRVAWFPIAFLVLAVPIPSNLYVDLTMPLRKIASQGSSEVLGMIPGLQTEVAGVVIDYVYDGSPGSLNVEQACSGMRLTMAFVTLGVAMAYLGDRPFWQRVIMVLSCIPIAIMCNLIRVTITGVLYVFRDEPIGQRWNFDSLSHGTPHALLGIAMLPIALGSFALVGWVLRNLVVEDTEEPVPGSQEAT